MEASPPFKEAWNAEVITESCGPAFVRTLK